MKAIRFALQSILLAIAIQTASGVMDPTVGRWLSRDPVGEDGGINLYGYVSNNPINLWDPWGLDQLEFYTPGSDGQLTADSRGKPPNEFNVGAHGPSDGKRWYNEDTRKWGNATDLAKEILNKKDYDPSKPVRLNICNAGKDGGLAEQLAVELNNRVIASPGDVNNRIWDFGLFKLVGPTSAPKGWKSFGDTSK
jgi:uncharacterized protein RhaS with RHS repeats